MERVAVAGGSAGWEAAMIALLRFLFWPCERPAEVFPGSGKNPRQPVPGEYGRCCGPGLIPAIANRVGAGSATLRVSIHAAASPPRTYPTPNRKGIP
jgi:hypothetical protein